MESSKFKSLSGLIVDIWNRKSSFDDFEILPQRVSRVLLLSMGSPSTRRELHLAQMAQTPFPGASHTLNQRECPRPVPPSRIPGTVAVDPRAGNPLTLIELEQGSLHLFWVGHSVIPQSCLDAHPTERFIRSIKRQAVQIRKPAPFPAFAVNQVG